MQKPEDVLRYWLDEVGPKGWYSGRTALDAALRERFLDTWEGAMEGACGLWLTYPVGTLAYIILTDQFPRNMFRDTDQAYESDRHARAACKVAVTRDWDQRISEPARQFFYLPLMHSENLVDQDRAVRLVAARMARDLSDNLLHAQAHREVIRQFGRFPFRNAAMGRVSTPAEAAWLAAGAYPALVQAMRDSRAA
jgi:uncharacterized protein (DUF924 family)